MWDSVSEDKTSGSEYCHSSSHDSDEVSKQYNKSSKRKITKRIRKKTLDRNSKTHSHKVIRILQNIKIENGNEKIKESEQTPSDAANQLGVGSNKENVHDVGDKIFLIEKYLNSIQVYIKQTHKKTPVDDFVLKSYIKYIENLKMDKVNLKSTSSNLIILSPEELTKLGLNMILANKKKETSSNTESGSTSHSIKQKQEIKKSFETLLEHESVNSNVDMLSKDIPGTKSIPLKKRRGRPKKNYKETYDESSANPKSNEDYNVPTSKQTLPTTNETEACFKKPILNMLTTFLNKKAAKNSTDKCADLNSDKYENDSNISKKEKQKHLKSNKKTCLTQPESAIAGKSISEGECNSHQKLSGQEICEQNEGDSEYPKINKCKNKIIEASVRQEDKESPPKKDEPKSLHEEKNSSSDSNDIETKLFKNDKLPLTKVGPSKNIKKEVIVLSNTSVSFTHEELKNLVSPLKMASTNQTGLVGATSSEAATTIHVKNSDQSIVLESTQKSDFGVFNQSGCNERKSVGNNIINIIDQSLEEISELELSKIDFINNPQKDTFEPITKNEEQSEVIGNTSHESNLTPEHIFSDKLKKKFRESEISSKLINYVHQSSSIIEPFGVGDTTDNEKDPTIEKDASYEKKSLENETDTAENCMSSAEIQQIQQDINSSEICTLDITMREDISESPSLNKSCLECISSASADNCKIESHEKSDSSNRECKSLGTKEELHIDDSIKEGDVDYHSSPLNDFDENSDKEQYIDSSSPINLIKDQKTYQTGPIEKSYEIVVAPINSCSQSNEMNYTSNLEKVEVDSSNDLEEVEPNQEHNENFLSTSAPTIRRGRKRKLTMPISYQIEQSTSDLKHRKISNFEMDHLAEVQLNYMKNYKQGMPEKIGIDFFTDVSKDQSNQNEPSKLEKDLKINCSNIESTTESPTNEIKVESNTDLYEEPKPDMDYVNSSKILKKKKGKNEKYILDSGHNINTDDSNIHREEPNVKYIGSSNLSEKKEGDHIKHILDFDESLRQEESNTDNTADYSIDLKKKKGRPKKIKVGLVTDVSNNQMNESLKLEEDSETCINIECSAEISTNKKIIGRKILTVFNKDKEKLDSDMENIESLNVLKKERKNEKNLPNLDIDLNTEQTTDPIEKPLRKEASKIDYPADCSIDVKKKRGRPKKIKVGLVTDNIDQTIEMNEFLKLEEDSETLGKIERSAESSTKKKITEREILTVFNKDEEKLEPDRENVESSNIVKKKRKHEKHILDLDIEFYTEQTTDPIKKPSKKKESNIDYTAECSIDMKKKRGRPKKIKVGLVTDDSNDQTIAMNESLKLEEDSETLGHIECSAESSNKKKITGRKILTIFNKSEEKLDPDMENVESLNILKKNRKHEKNVPNLDIDLNTVQTTDPIEKPLRNEESNIDYTADCSIDLKKKRGRPKKIKVGLVTDVSNDQTIEINESLKLGEDSETLGHIECSAESSTNKKITGRQILTVFNKSEEKLDPDMENVESSNILKKNRKHEKNVPNLDIDLNTVQTTDPIEKPLRKEESNIDYTADCSIDVKKKRGRPKKIKVGLATDISNDQTNEMNESLKLDDEEKLESDMENVENSNNLKKKREHEKNLLNLDIDFNTVQTTDPIKKSLRKEASNIDYTAECSIDLKRKRGRPKKIKVGLVTDVSNDQTIEMNESSKLEEDSEILANIEYSAESSTEKKLTGRRILTVFNKEEEKLESDMEIVESSNISKKKRKHEKNIPNLDIDLNTVQTTKTVDKPSRKEESNIDYTSDCSIDLKKKIGRPRKIKGDLVSDVGNDMSYQMNVSSKLEEDKETCNTNIECSGESSSVKELIGRIILTDVHEEKDEPKTDMEYIESSKKREGKYEKHIVHTTHSIDESLRWEESYIDYTTQKIKVDCVADDSNDQSDQVNEHLKLDEDVEISNRRGERTEKQKNECIKSNKYGRKKNNDISSSNPFNTETCIQSTSSRRYGGVDYSETNDNVEDNPRRKKIKVETRKSNMEYPDNTTIHESYLEPITICETGEAKSMMLENTPSKSKYTFHGRTSDMLNSVFSAAFKTSDLQEVADEQNQSIPPMKGKGCRGRPRSSATSILMDGEGNVFCVLCEKNIPRTNWEHHNQSEHYSLGWCTGQDTVAVDDDSAVEKILRLGRKKKVQLKCYKCGYISTTVHSYLIHFEECRGILSDGMVICAVCNMKMERGQWIPHKLKHNNLAWRIGDVPLDLNDKGIVMSVLNAMYKARKPLHCEKCGTTKKSVIGYMSHRSQCGAETDVLVECKICSKKMLPVSMLTHLKWIHGPKKEKSDYFDVNIDTPLSKRKAAKNALSMLESFSREGGLPYFFSNMDYKEHSFVVPLLETELETRGVLRCKFEICEFQFNNVETLLDHMALCVLKPNEYYTCSKCLSTLSQDEKKSHLIEFHNITISDDDNIPYDLSDDEGNLTDRKMKISRNTALFRDVPRCIRNCRKKVGKSLLFPKAFNFNFEFCQNHYNQPNLYNNLRYSNSNWCLLDDELIEEYLPKMTKSCRVAWKRVKNENGILGQEVTFKEFELFEHVQDVHTTIFCGGPISSLAWLPTPYNMPNCEQILAVATLHDYDDKYKMFQHYSKPSVIQFWNFGTLRNKVEVPEPKLHFCLAVAFGPVLNMEWCPSGCFDVIKSQDFDLQRNGVLAVSGTTSSVRIFSIPFLRDDQMGLIYQVKPLVKLQLVLEVAMMKRETYPSKISWSKIQGHRHIAVGYTDGSVGIFDLATDSQLLKCKDEEGIDVILPYKVIKAHRHCITALSFVHLNSGARWLFTGSFDKFCYLWDLNNESSMVTATRKIISDGTWLTHWVAHMTASDESGSNHVINGFIQAHRNYLSEPTTLLKSYSTISSISFNDWLNVCIQSSSEGEICLFLPSQLLYAFDNSKNLTCRYYLSSTYLIDTTKSEEQRMADHKKKQTILNSFLNSTKKSHSSVVHRKSELYDTHEPLMYKEATEKYGILFCDLSRDTVQNFPPVRRTSINELDSMKYSSPNKYPLHAITKVSFNPNCFSSLYFATGHQAGFIRLSYLKFLENELQVKI